MKLMRLEEKQELDFNGKRLSEVVFLFCLISTNFFKLLFLCRIYIYLNIRQRKIGGKMKKRYLNEIFFLGRIIYIPLHYKKKEAIKKAKLWFRKNLSNTNYKICSHNKLIKYFIFDSELKKLTISDSTKIYKCWAFELAKVEENKLIVTKHGSKKYELKILRKQLESARKCYA